MLEQIITANKLVLVFVLSNFFSSQNYPFLFYMFLIAWFTAEHLIQSELTGIKWGGRCKIHVQAPSLFVQFPAAVDAQLYQDGNLSPELFPNTLTNFLIWNLDGCPQKMVIFGWSPACVPFVICLLIVVILAVNCRVVSRLLDNSPVSQL